MLQYCAEVLLMTDIRISPIICLSPVCICPRETSKITAVQDVHDLQPRDAAQQHAAYFEAALRQVAKRKFYRGTGLNKPTHKPLSSPQV